MEFYIKSIDDPHFDKYKLQSESDIAQVITQLEVLLFTKKGEVLGEPDFGCDLESLIFEFSYNDYQLTREINQQIDRYCPLARRLQTVVSTTYERGEDRDAIFIDITIDSQYQIKVII